MKYLSLKKERFLKNIQMKFKNNKNFFVFDLLIFKQIKFLNLKYRVRTQR